MEHAVDLIEPRAPDGLGFLLKARATGRLYRLMPTRDPRQPRFWCFMIFRCTSAGVAAPAERPWTGAGGMTREELPEALAAIRRDVDGWLAQDQCRELRRWLLAADAEPADPPRLAARNGAAGHRRRAAVPQAGGDDGGVGSADALPAQ